MSNLDTIMRKLTDKFNLKDILQSNCLAGVTLEVTACSFQSPLSNGDGAPQERTRIRGEEQVYTLRTRGGGDGGSPCAGPGPGGARAEPLRAGPHGAAPAPERVNGRAPGFALAHLKHQDLEHLPRASPAARRTSPGETRTAAASPQSCSPCRYSLAKNFGGENLQGRGPRGAAPPPGSAPRSPRAQLRPRTAAANSGRLAELRARTPPVGVGAARSGARTAPSRPTPDRRSPETSKSHTDANGRTTAAALRTAPWRRGQRGWGAGGRSFGEGRHVARSPVHASFRRPHDRASPRGAEWPPRKPLSCDSHFAQSPSHGLED
uniref:Uncharacterized protein n=1 Tax=Rangifer tarandus platyrhynchus TaxID=3082113 RepID=A0ACB0E9U8_RANTA|nr:unnamed protein product [Rangifer tarandus platyrhynchus]